MDTYYNKDYSLITETVIRVFHFRGVTFLQIKLPKPFLFEAGKRAVLLLHGFTGHSADVRMLGRYLEKKGYTSYAPIYRGHGRSPEALIQSNPDEWWEDVVAAYNHLKESGFDEIAVAGLSMGGTLGLKLASSNEVKGVIPMCTPMYFDNDTQLTKSFLLYAQRYKEFEKKEKEVIKEELDALFHASRPLFNKIETFVTDVSKQVDLIYTPTFIVQARNDEIINPESANYIYQHIEADKKELKWYENSGHAITFGPERDSLHEDIYHFLEGLDWQTNK